MASSETDEYSDSDDYDYEPVIFRGRKEIKSIKSFGELVALTKRAHFEEKARIVRLKAHLRELNTYHPNNYKDDLILDVDVKNGNVLVEVHPHLRAFLKTHQKDGVRFMWDSCCETVERVNADFGSGCILAHCMGLGKTLQVISFVYTVLTNKNVKISKVLVLCPKNTLLNWVNEFDKWIQSPLSKLRIYCPSSGSDKRDSEILDWSKRGGVLIMSYNAFRILVESQTSTGKRPIYEALINPGPDLVVCDEGHILKNAETKLAKVVTQMKTLRRVILTGTPLQNNLIEYFCMVNFVRPNLLGTKSEFSNMFVNPIHNGQYEDSYDNDVALMKARSHVLHRTLSPVVQRFDYSTLAEYLPTKLEYVLSVRLTEEQGNLYQHYLDAFDNDMPWTKRAKGLFADYQLLQRVWTHPYSLKLYDARLQLLENMPKKIKKKKNRGASKDSDDDNDDSGDEYEVVRPKKWKPGWWIPFIPAELVETIEAGSKLVVLFDIIRECEKNGEKLLVFSGSLFSLEMIEYFLTKKWSKNGTAAWIPGQDYFILSGATSAPDRDEMCKQFNDPSNSETRLFMISTKAGGLGITLNAANRAVIFDASWNPSHDIQSIFRIYRLGQDKPCFVYRLVASGTMEEKIYLRQVTKQSVSHRVVDEKQIARHYSSHELKELYELEMDKQYTNNPQVAAKDPLLDGLLKKHGDIIAGYHEHDSLLEHKTEEELNVLDKMDAWSDFSSESDPADNAIVQLMSPEMFNVENFKIVIRRHFEAVPESTVCSLADQLVPRVFAVMEKVDFKDLMLLEALEARMKEEVDEDNSIFRKPSTSLRKGTTYLAGRGAARKAHQVPQPVRQWGLTAGKAYGSPSVSTTDDDDDD